LLKVQKFQLYSALCWKRASENMEDKFSNITKLGMNPHRDTRTGGDAMTDLG